MVRSGPAASEPHNGSTVEPTDSESRSLELEIADNRRVIADLEERVRRAEALAESYRDAAKARGEEISRLLTTVSRASKADETELRRELDELRGHQSRKIVRWTLRAMDPVDRSYRAMRRRASRSDD